MNPVISFLITTSILLFNAIGASMLGLNIGDSKSSLDKVKLDKVVSEINIIKYRTENGNDFSVTLKNDTIVYMENDWLQSDKGRTPLVTNFEFGKTSLKDIRKKFGTNGFTYKERMAFATETDIIQFNCFEIESSKNEILVIITKFPMKLQSKATENNIAELLKFEAIIVANKEYLDEIWGTEKLYDANYKKIKL